MNTSANYLFKQTITIFLWYRFMMLAYVGILALSGLRAVPIIALFLAAIYNLFIFRYREIVIETLHKYPYLIAIDMIVSTLLRLNSGAYKNPYFLYFFSTLFLGGFLFGYRGAFLLAGIQSLLLVIVDYAVGMNPSYLLDYGEHIATYILYNFFLAIIMAYLSDLLDKLDLANKKKQTVETQLGEAKKCLGLSLIINQLSLREMQVLTLSSEGRTVDEVAEELGISKNTVKTYLRRIYEKLEVSSKQEAISLVARQETGV